MSYATASAYTVFPGNARACLLRVDGTNQADLAVIDRAVSYDGTAHHAPVSRKASTKLHRAVRSHKAEAWYPSVEGEAAGASVEYASVLTLWNEAKKEFTHYAAIYGEDTSVFADVSKAFRERTKSAENPKGIGLGTWFEEERIRHWTQNATLAAPFGLVPAARIGEYSPHSAAMIAIFKKLGARLGTEAQGITEVDGRDVRPAWDVLPEVGKFYSPDGKLLNHIFPVPWSSDDGKQQIVATFTEGISTFTGDSVVRVQITSNGNLPDKAILKDILTSLLAAGQKEIDKREWGKNSPIIRAVSPRISLGGSAMELQISAFSIAADEIAQRRSSDAAPVSLMRIHSFEEGIVDALPGYSRLLGPHATRPVIVDFASIPQDVLGVAVPPAKQLIVTSAMPRGVTLH